MNGWIAGLPMGKSWFTNDKDFKGNRWSYRRPTTRVKREAIRQTQEWKGGSVALRKDN